MQGLYRRHIYWLFFPSISWFTCVWKDTCNNKYKIMNIIKRLKNWSIGPCTKLIHRSAHKTITNTICTSKNTARNYLCQFHLRPLLCSCVLWHIVILWLLYFRRDIVLPSSGNTYPLKLHHCWPVQSQSQKCSTTRCFSSTTSQWWHTSCR
jgi:hypothetical protein